MLSLVLVYCLASDPHQCQERRPVFAEPLTSMTCLIHGQLAGAEYVRQHPDWRLSGWRCEVGRVPAPA